METGRAKWDLNDLLEFREELAGERLVIEDGADRQYVKEAPQP